MHKHDLALLSPEHSFQCPYCKSVFSVVDNKIKMVEAGKTVRPPTVHPVPATDYGNMHGSMYS